MSDAAGQHAEAFQLLPGDGFLVSALGFGDVLDHGEAVQRQTLGIADDGRGQCGPNDVAILLHVSFLHPIAGDFPTEHPPGKFPIYLQVFRIRDIPEGHSGEFRFGVADHATQRTVDLQEAVILSHQRNAQRAFFKHLAETLLAFAQRSLGFLALRDIETDARHTYRLTGIIQVDRTLRQQPVDAAVRPQYAEFAVPDVRLFDTLPQVYLDGVAVGRMDQLRATPRK